MLSITGCVGVTGAPTAPTQKSESVPAASAISVSPSSINFGSVAVDGTVSQSVTISNTGGASLTVTKASASASGFTIVGMSFPLVIKPGSHSSLDVVFSPRSTAPVSGTVSIASDATNSPSSVSVSGTGIAATALLNAGVPSINFGSVSVGASGVLAVSMTNGGNSNITISGVSSSSGRFTTNGVSTGMVLTSGQSAALDVTFSPTSAGSSTGSIAVESNATNSPAIISVSGSGNQTIPHSAKLTWDASPSVVAGYNVYRSAISGGPYTRLNASSVSLLSYADPTVAPGNVYYYTVTAVASDGAESVNSDQVSATIPSP
jgi:hypothetical protein